MSKIGLICEAVVPRGMRIEIKVLEDIDGDGEFENENTQKLKDGKYVYELSGFQGDQDNEFSHEVTMGRDPDGPQLSPFRDDPQPPALSSFQTILSGPPESNEIDPKAVVYKLEEADYFLYQMRSNGLDVYHHNLSGFLSAVYSIDEIIPSEWSDWADSGGEAELHDMIIENRHQNTHLRKPAKGSLRPPLSSSIKYDFSKPEDKSFIQHGYSFVGVPVSVIEEYVPEEDRLNMADNSISLTESPYARIVSATDICRIYFRLLQKRIDDWIDSLDNDDYPYKVDDLKSR